MQNLIRLSFVKLFLFFFFIVVCLSEVNKRIRIVSLTPSITESLYILGEGENVVGITKFCRRISNNQKIVGTFLELNVEEIVRLSPDVVVVSKEGPRKELVDKLKRVGLKVIVFDPVNSFEQIKYQFLKIGTIINKYDLAKEIVEEYQNKLHNFPKLKNSKKVICILSIHPIFVASDKSYIGEIIKYAGGENAIKSKISFPQIDIEEVIKVKPDIIILPDMGISEKEIISFFQPYKEIPAAKNKKIYVLPSNILCQPTIKNFYTAVNEVYKILNE